VVVDGGAGVDGAAAGAETGGIEVGVGAELEVAAPRESVR